MTPSEHFSANSLMGKGRDSAARVAFRAYHRRARDSFRRMLTAMTWSGQTTRQPRQSRGGTSWASGYQSSDAVIRGVVQRRARAVGDSLATSVQWMSEEGTRLPTLHRGRGVKSQEATITGFDRFLNRTFPSPVPIVSTPQSQTSPTCGIRLNP